MAGGAKKKNKRLVKKAVRRNLNRRPTSRRRAA
jgi:hypothetical protein